MSTEFVEKDSKIGYIVVIVILILAVLGLSGYIVYDKFAKEEVIEENVDEVVEAYELSASHVANLIEKVEVYNKYLYKYYLMDNNEEIPDEMYYYFAYSVLMSQGKDVTAENVSNVLRDYFGENFTELDDIICEVDGEVLYEYDSNNNIYIEGEHSGHGGSRQAASNIRYVSSRVEGNKVTLVTKILYERSCGDICGPLNAYYSSINDAFDDVNPVLGDLELDEEIILTDELFDSVEDELPKTTYNFILEENGNYILDSVSIEE